jgi:hypothetical protein
MTLHNANCITVVPWFANIIRSGNVLVIQSTRISKRTSPYEIMETQIIRSKTQKYSYKNEYKIHIHLFIFLLFKFNIHQVIEFINYWVGRLSLSLTESLLSVDSFSFCETLTRHLSNDTCFCLLPNLIWREGCLHLFVLLLRRDLHNLLLLAIQIRSQLPPQSSPSSYRLPFQPFLHWGHCHSIVNKEQSLHFNTK